MPPIKALVTGHFSTVGDIDSLELVRRWIVERGGDAVVAPYTAAVREWLEGAMDPRELDPSVFTHVVVVCGPFWRDYFTRDAPIDLRSYAHCRFIGVNLSVLDPDGSHGAFDSLLYRDTRTESRPDLTFVSERDLVPVVGVCVVRCQPEYGCRQLHERAIRAIRDFLLSRDLVTVEIDTRLPPPANRAGLRSPAQIETLLARVDVVVTTRLHGMVYALKHGVPAVVVDPVRGGAKVSAQARVIGWPHVLLAEETTPERLDALLRSCLDGRARELARECASRARAMLATARAEFENALGGSPGGAWRWWTSLPRSPPRWLGLLRRLIPRPVRQRLSSMRRGRWEPGTGG